MTTHTRTLIIQQGAAINLHDLTSHIDDRKGERTTKMFMAARSQNTKALQPTPHVVGTMT